jgi:type IV fimbrial biogenesis protein FimT
MFITAARSCTGRSLLELVVALAIAAWLTHLAVPAYGHWMATIEQRNAASALLEALQEARSEAIKRSSRVTVCQSANGLDCASDGAWERGWIAFADADADGERGAEAPIRVEASPRPRITIAGNRPVAHYVSYTGFGQPRTLSGALQMGTFTVCRHGLTALDLVIAASGRPRIATTTTPCP